jgi:hypothetical protein
MEKCFVSKIFRAEKFGAEWNYEITKFYLSVQRILIEFVIFLVGL